MDLQHVNVKLLLHQTGDADLEPVIPVFHTWIQDQVCEELLLDVADYRHVHAGPGVVLVGHEANYSVDNSDSKLGVRYNRKAAVEGNNQDRLAQALRAALIACQRLESDPRLHGLLRFNGQEIEVFINDRLLAPNTQETRAALQPEFQAFFEKLFVVGGFSLSNNAHDPRRLFSLSVRSTQAFSVSDLLKNLPS
jgi:hypothetical protein